MGYISKNGFEPLKCPVCHKEQGQRVGAYVLQHAPWEPNSHACKDCGSSFVVYIGREGFYIEERKAP
jgi:ssDNA-binding Zn-finger/Zn-ribbon topoisomerase 1